jgi:hypothetical protein
MEKEIQNTDNNIQLETLYERWKNLHKISGISTLVILVLLLGEVVVYAVLPSPSSTIECIELFIRKPLFGLLHFDLLGMISYLLFIPLMLSLYTILRRNSESVSLIATVLFLVGIAVFFASNTAFSLLSLIKQYAVAVTETEKAMLMASCHATITLFNVQAFMISYIIISAAWVMISIVMLWSGLFNRFTAYMGILAGASGIIAEILENTSKLFINVAVAFYFAAIVFLFIWVLLTGRKLLSIGAILHTTDNQNNTQHR